LALQQREVLRMARDSKRKQIDEAAQQLAALESARQNCANRVAYYQGLVNDGLISSELAEQGLRHTATALKTAEGINRMLAAIFYLSPQVGSPFAMKFGGKEMGDSTAAWASWAETMASVFDAMSASAGLEAGFRRREQEWQQQLTVAAEDLVQTERQRLAAEIRLTMAQTDLEIHEKTQEQADEPDAIHQDKLSNLGLYTYLSTTLNRLHREAYLAAYQLASAAERAFQYERDSDATFIAPDNWSFERSGLLAADRLSLQLEQMARAYLEQNVR